MTDDVEWTEIWLDSSSSAYVLAVRGVGADRIEVRDPQEGWKVVASFDDYESAVHWLNEDEYDLVEGRVAEWRPRGPEEK